MCDENHVIITLDGKLSEEQANMMALNIEYSMIGAIRLQIEGYLESDIDKSNTGNAIISMLSRLKLIPPYEQYGQLIKSIWSMYDVPLDMRDWLGEHLNMQVSEYNKAILDDCTEVYNDMRERGLTNDDDV